MHTAEHLLNQTMVRMFGCKRSENAHIERKKSKISFILGQEPTPQQVEEIVMRMQELIKADLPVTYRMEPRSNLTAEQQRRLPEGMEGEVRMVRIGDYDDCPCIGLHVEHTAQIGTFVLLVPTGTKRNIRFVSALSSKGPTAARGADGFCRHSLF